MEKLTKDHNKAQELVDAGLLKEEEADNHRSSHILTRALGSPKSAIPVIEAWPVERKEIFFLSTDGLFRVLSAEQVKEVLAFNYSVEEKCRVLMDNALEGGAPDNVSFILTEPEKKGFLNRIFS